MPGSEEWKETVRNHWNDELVGRMEDYLRHHDEVQGWFLPQNAIIFLLLSHFQHTQLALRGAVGEIGVYHGLSFIPLALSALHVDEKSVDVDIDGDIDEKIFGIDVFQQVHLNIDRSGDGDFDTFSRNIARFGIGLDRVDLHQTSSTLLSLKELAPGTGCVRFFNIDGGHTAEITHHDLNLAACLACRHGGVVVLDDIPSEDWPGVMEGYSRFMIHQPEITPGNDNEDEDADVVYHEKWLKAGLVPFLRGFNKMYMTTVETHEQMYDWVRDHPLLKNWLYKRDYTVFETIGYKYHVMTKWENMNQDLEKHISAMREAVTR